MNLPAKTMDPTASIPWNLRSILILAFTKIDGSPNLVSHRSSGSGPHLPVATQAGLPHPGMGAQVMVLHLLVV